IEREIDLAARRESPLKIAKKKIPFTRSPARIRRPVSIKSDRKRGDPIALLVKIRERLERLNSEHRPWHAEDFEQFLEERRFVNVEAKNGMTEPFQDEQKKAAAAPKIEHAQGSRAMKFQVLDSLTINAQPLIDIGIFLSAVPFLDFGEPVLIKAGENRPQGQSKNRTLRSSPASPVRFPACQLREFPMQLHGSASAISRSNPGPRWIRPV